MTGRASNRADACLIRNQKFLDMMAQFIYHHYDFFYLMPHSWMMKLLFLTVHSCQNGVVNIFVSN